MHSGLVLIGSFPDQFDTRQIQYERGYSLLASVQMGIQIQL